jgi:hypothetical protein
VVVAPAPERPIDGGMATEALVAHIVVSKFCDALPLHRQARMLARQGVALDRSMLSHWVGRACWWLTPLYELILSTVLSSGKLFADDTTLPVLDPGRGRTKTGRLWCYAVDDRPWNGPGHPAAAYVYSADRKNARPAEHLAGFQGVLQVDGYNGFKRLAGRRADASVQLAFCWAHMRRGFYDFYISTKSPLAAEVMARIRTLYAIEAGIRGQCAEHRHQVRQERSRPIVEALHGWLQDHVPRVSAASDLAKAMHYALRHWSGLVVFLDDGRVEMDTNVVERAIRPIPLTRKNALFAGSDVGASYCPSGDVLMRKGHFEADHQISGVLNAVPRHRDARRPTAGRQAGLSRGLRRTGAALEARRWSPFGKLSLGSLSEYRRLRRA